MSDRPESSSSSTLPSSSPPEDPSLTPAPATDAKTRLLTRAQASLRQTLKRYGVGQDTPKASAPTAVRQSLDHITKELDKLEHGVLRIAVFGLVSRGKSSVINALVQQDVLKTGPLHGVTKWPRSVYWTPADNTSGLQIELIDTPGLDEIDGQARAEMANEVAQEADLILFVVAGTLTPIECEAISILLHQQKPLLLVANKTDLYPDLSPQSLLLQIEQHGSKATSSPSSSLSAAASPAASSASAPVAPGGDRASQPLPTLGKDSRWPLTLQDIVQVSAAPAPLQVRVEWPDGRVTHEWESPPPDLQPLVNRLHDIVHNDGVFLIALNALDSSRMAEVTIAQTSLQSRDEQAEDLLWEFAKWKGLVVAANPVAILDVAVGLVVDVVMIRSLARLYDLPMTGHDANQLWQAIAWSSGGLALGEIGSGLLWGLGKSTALVIGPVGTVMSYTTTAIAQATLAGYGSYRVGKAAQLYLQQGCTWGPHGASTVIQAMTQAMDDSSIKQRISELLLSRPNPGS